MEKIDTVIAVFADHSGASGCEKLTAVGFEMRNRSIVGKGYRQLCSIELKCNLRLGKV